MTNFPRRDFLRSLAGLAIVPLPLYEFDVRRQGLMLPADRPPKRLARRRPDDPLTVGQPTAGARSATAEDLGRRLSSPSLVLDFDSDAHPGDTIRPGQPLSFRWSLSDFSALQDRFVELPGLATISYRGNVLFGPSRDRTAVVSITDRLGIHGPPFFRVGQLNELVIQVTGTPDGHTYNDTNSLQVVADRAPTWEWTRPPGAFRWKRDTYTLAGNLRNNAEFAQITVTPVMHEVPNHLGILPRELTPQGGLSYPVAPTREIRIPFPSIQWTEDRWRWFDPSTFVTIEEFHRTFLYRCDFHAVDEYNNAYIVADSGLEVEVRVDDSKLGKQNAAFATQYLAIVALVAAAFFGIAGLGYVAGGLVTVATTLEAVAQSLAAGALDPPSPDPHFLEPVVIRQALPGKGQEAGAPSQMSANLAAFLTLARRIADVPAALSQIEGRLLGAQQAGDQTGIDLQTAGYIKAVQTLLADAQSLIKLQPALVQELRADPNFEAKNLQQGFEILQKGIPAPLREELKKSGMSDEVLATLEKAIRNTDYIKTLQTMEIGAIVENVTSAMAQVALDARAETPKILQPMGKPKTAVAEPVKP